MCIQYCALGWYNKLSKVIQKKYRMGNLKMTPYSKLQNIALENLGHTL
jgi:hypothetical protein